MDVLDDVLVSFVTKIMRCLTCLRAAFQMRWRVGLQVDHYQMVNGFPRVCQRLVLSQTSTPIQGGFGHARAVHLGAKSSIRGEY